MTKAKCNRCGKQREVRAGSHFGGGSYKRPGRMYSSNICRECAVMLLTYITPGHRRVSNWDILTLRRIWNIEKEES
jgi:hypothetical protein